MHLELCFKSFMLSIESIICETYNNSFCPCLAVTFDISIPDKQRLKPGQATIRLYPTFFSIIANKHYKCISRWFSNDVLRYSAFDNSHFVFEIAAKSKGQIVNLLVPNNAYEIAKAFEINKFRNNADNNGKS